MENLRYERKFLAQNSSLADVSNVVKLNPKLFIKKYKERFINNIYFDSLNYSLYNDNLFGTSNRFKVRIRWYDNLLGKIEKPVLEIKNKKNLIGSKDRYSLDSFNLNKKTQIDELKDLINIENFPQKIKALNIFPVLINRYLRNYFESADKKYRLTVDTNLIYYSILGKNIFFNEPRKEEGLVILELKYGLEQNNYANRISNHFPFRKIKFSKYVRGIQTTREVVI